MDRQEYTRNSCGTTPKVIPNSPRTQVYLDTVRKYKEFMKKNKVYY